MLVSSPITCTVEAVCVCVCVCVCVQECMSCKVTPLLFCDLQYCEPCISLLVLGCRSGNATLCGCCDRSWIIEVSWWKRTEGENFGGLNEPNCVWICVCECKRLKYKKKAFQHNFQENELSLRYMRGWSCTEMGTCVCVCVCVCVCRTPDKQEIKQFSCQWGQWADSLSPKHESKSKG